MENELVELCPICIENKAEYYTECGHCYCIGCLRRIKKCAMCRKSLIRTKLCIEIKSKNNGTTDINHYFDLDTNEPPQIIGNYYNVLRIMAGMGGLSYSN